MEVKMKSIGVSIFYRQYRHISLKRSNFDTSYKDGVDDMLCKSVNCLISYRGGEIQGRRSEGFPNSKMFGISQSPIGDQLENG